MEEQKSIPKCIVCKRDVTDAEPLPEDQKQFYAVICKECEDYSYICCVSHTDAI